MIGLMLTIAGRELVCRPSGALWLEAERTLIAADLHLEKGSAYARRGQLLPPYDTGETLARLEADVAALAPDRIIFLGDSFHDGEACGRLSAADSARIGALASDRDLVWVVGNHDRDGLAGLPGERLTSLALGGLEFIHEPAPGRAPGEVAGHLHPCAKVASPAGAVRRRCFVTDGERLILPAFGAYAGGLNVCDPAIRGRLGDSKAAAVLGRGRVHLIPWTALKGD